MVANKNVELKSQPDCVNSNQDRLGLKCISKQQTSAIASEVRVRVSANKRITALLLAAPVSFLISWQQQSAYTTHVV